MHFEKLSSSLLHPYFYEYQRLFSQNALSPFLYVCVVCRLFLAKSCMVLGLKPYLHGCKTNSFQLSSVSDPDPGRKKSVKIIENSYKNLPNPQF